MKQGRLTDTVSRIVRQVRWGSQHRWVRHVVVVPVLLCMVLLTNWDIARDSPTEDEFTHMVRGIAYWQGPDARLSYGHPALANALTALPVAFDAENPRIAELEGFESATASAVTVSYLKADYGHARQQLSRARWAPIVLGLLLAAYAYFWGFSVLGYCAAIASIVMVAFNPIIIAQARYVTTDTPATLGMAVAIGELIRFLLGRRWTLVTFPLGVALALLMKYSGLVVIPVAAIAIAASAIAKRGRYAGTRPLSQALRGARDLMVAGIVAVLAINAVYRFEETGLTVSEILERKEPRYWVSSAHDYRLIEQLPLMTELPRDLRIPLPYTYLYGIAGLHGHVDSGFSSFFWDRAIRRAPVEYYPIMLGIKNPPGLLALLAVALGLAFTVRRVTIVGAVLTGTIVLYMVLAVRSGLAMGVRHLEPALVPLTWLAAYGFTRAWTWWRAWEARSAFTLLLASVPISALMGGPDFLGYFNFLIGGRAGGHEVSVYGEDWGQDRVRLADLARRYKLRPLYYNPMTKVRGWEASYQGLEYRALGCQTRITGGWAAIHLLTMRTRDAGCYDFVEQLEPIWRINDHIMVYWIPKGGSAAED